MVNPFPVVSDAFRFHLWGKHSTLNAELEFVFKADDKLKTLIQNINEALKKSGYRWVNKGSKGRGDIFF